LSGINSDGGEATGVIEVDTGDPGVVATGLVVIGSLRTGARAGGSAESSLT